MSASETPKSKLETSSFPPVSTPAPAPKPLSNRSCCHFSGSCFGCNETGISLTGARASQPAAAPGADKGPPASAFPPRADPPPQPAAPPRPKLRLPSPYPAVGRGPVPAAAPGHHRPVPHGAAARAPAAHAAPAGPAPACGAAPASAATAAPAGPTLAPVQLNDVVQGHVHLVSHDGGTAPTRTSGRAAAAPEAEEAGLRRCAAGARSFLGWAALPAGPHRDRDRNMRVRVRSWHGVASWLWVANDENCGICRMAFNGCCPDCECGTGTDTGHCALGGADGLSVPQVKFPVTTVRWCGGSARTASTCTASSSG